MLKSFATRASLTAEELARFTQTAREDEEACLEKVTRKGHREWSTRLLEQVEKVCGFTYLGVLKPGLSQGESNPGRKAARHREFAVMLDHAARRVSALHTWVKRAEAERRQFSAAIEKLRTLCQRHPEAVQWLDRFCAQRTDLTRTEDDYRIRPRAVEGWREVVAAWQRLPNDAPVEDRIAAARELQDSDEIEKFGDIQLFEALAEDDARCVWQAGPAVLVDYVAGRWAEFKLRQRKVPAYCHPDPLRHPVFCDFGNSRWPVKFALHRARSGLAEARSKVTRRRNDVAKAEARLARARKDTARAELEAELARARAKLNAAEAELHWLETPHALALTLLDGDRPTETNLRWQSKRLVADLALNSDAASPPAPVSRADRHGRAAAGARPGQPVEVLGLFEQAHWNCRLQAPREQLEALARHLDKQQLGLADESRWDARAHRLRDRLEWFVTFSARLRPQGPWPTFAREHAELIQPLKEHGAVVLAPRGEKDEWRGLAWPFRHQLNESGRSGRAKFALAHLPGLRLLAADLGHRFGAACAVWETLSPAALRALCGEARPGPDALFHLLTQPGPDGRPRTTLLRRVGPDTLPDGTPHPAPWAKLERQFLIKLQGEEADARMAGPQELKFIEELEATCGLAPEHRRSRRRREAKAGRGPRPSLSVDDLMFHAVDTLRLALRRHATHARLARDFPATHKIVPGNQRVPLPEDERLQFLTDLLLTWYDLATSRRTPDQDAKQLWDKHVAPHLAGQELEARPEGRETAPTRKARDAHNADKLRDFAGALTAEKRRAISRDWAEVWQKHDAGFQRLLARLRHWLRPRGVRKRERERRIQVRHTGGLSLTRLAALRAFYQVQKAFFTRLHPDGSTATAGEQFGQRTLAALERLREQRVKQLASRLAAAALGLAPAAPQPVERTARPQEAQRLARVRLNRLAQRFPACHAVVIENLSHYRPTQLRTRRENRQLMQWSSGKVRQFLAEACQLHGLHLREVSPAHTSRQDSRTGAPGWRCVDVPLKDFLRAGGVWAREVERLEQKKAAERRPGDALLLDTFRHWQAVSARPLPEQARRLAHGSIRLLQDGGDLFVSAHPDSPAAKGLQADLNAAANIGLKPLLDPDWPGSWWCVPCDPVTHVPLRDKVKGCSLPPFCHPGQPLALATPRAESGTKRNKRQKEKTVVNLWRDPGAAPLTCGEWLETRAYWAGVQSRVANLLRRHNGLPDHPRGISESPGPCPAEAEDDVPG